MELGTELTVRPLTSGEEEVYLHLVVAVDADSGVDGAGHAHANSSSEPLDVAAALNREVTRWNTPTDTVGWRRAWGLFDHQVLVGHLHLVGGTMQTELHRVGLGMGVDRHHRGRGGGTALLTAAIGWAESQPQIDWIDLGVFSDNTVAHALYLRHGFHVLGRTPDRYRVDGAVLEEIAMTRNVAGGGDVNGR